jgi:crotonobetainyl-CoA:carnitine CoA-transferase CaiB-like acyl-CoA transferase
MLAAPATSMYLADQGADVIKIEQRKYGDPVRTLGTNAFLGNYSKTYLTLNRSKRGMTLDIKKPAGLGILRRLVEGADIFIENFRPGVSERLGIGYEELSKLNPKLVYASVTAFGPRGPHKNRAGYDGIVAGVAGAMSRRGPDGRPIPVGVSAADMSLPMLMAYGIMLALWERSKTGIGQRVEGSLLHTYLALQLGTMMSVDEDKTPPRNIDQTSNLYQCADGQYIHVTVHTDKQFVRLCHLLDLPHLAEDPRVRDPAGKQELRVEVYPIVEELMRSAPSAEWLEKLDAADIPCGPVLDRQQIYTEPQAQANEMFMAQHHPKVGPTRMVNVPVRLSRTPGAVRNPAPLLGQHTDEVLRELGYGDADIDKLRTEEVI